MSVLAKKKEIRDCTPAGTYCVLSAHSCINEYTIIYKPDDIDYYKRRLLIRRLRHEENWRKCLISDDLSIHSTLENNNLSKFQSLINNITIEDIISELEETFSMLNINYGEYNTERLSR